MRAISISTEVFAAIWAKHLPGEESEDAILSRLLGVERKGETTGSSTSDTLPAGFVDSRSKTEFPAGMVIFRTYKGRDYRAQAIGGSWILDSTDEGYQSLNQLSKALGISSENAWQNWYYRDETTGRRQLISALRK